MLHQIDSDESFMAKKTKIRVLASYSKRGEMMRKLSFWLF